MNVNENKEIEAAQATDSRLCIWEDCSAPSKPGSKSKYCTVHRKTARQKWLELIIQATKGRRPKSDT